MYIFSLAICKELVYIYSKVIIQGFYTQKQLMVTIIKNKRKEDTHL